MGLVLAFETAPRPASRQPAARRLPAKSADVVFFTGVRYERERPASAQQPGATIRSPEPPRAS